MLETLLFNVFLADSFFVVNDIGIVSYADDNTPFMVADNADDLIISFEQACHAIPLPCLRGFKTIFWKSNADKCQLLVSTTDSVSINVAWYKIDKNDTGNLLGENSIKSCFLIPTSQTSAKRQVEKYLVRPELHRTRDLRRNAYSWTFSFTSEFNYWPLVWMCHSSTNINKTNRLRERHLRIAYIE